MFFWINIQKFLSNNNVETKNNEFFSTLPQYIYRVQIYDVGKVNIVQLRRNH